MHREPSSSYFDQIYPLVDVQEFEVRKTAQTAPDEFTIILKVRKRPPYYHKKAEK